MTDPVEKIIAAALIEADIPYVREQRTTNGRRIDFYLPSHGLWIECCRFHTERKVQQMETLSNAILVQGLDAARLLAGWITSNGIREGQENGARAGQPQEPTKVATPAPSPPQEGREA